MPVYVFVSRVATRVDQGNLFPPAYSGFQTSLLAPLMVTVAVSLTLLQAGPPNGIPHPGSRANKLV